MTSKRSGESSTTSSTPIRDDQEGSTTRTEANAPNGRCGRLALERALRKTRYTYAHPTPHEEALLWDVLIREAP